MNIPAKNNNMSCMMTQKTCYMCNNVPYVSLDAMTLHVKNTPNRPKAKGSNRV